MALSPSRSSNFLAGLDRLGAGHESLRAADELPRAFRFHPRRARRRHGELRGPGGSRPHVDSYDVFCAGGTGGGAGKSRQDDRSFDLKILERFTPEAE